MSLKAGLGCVICKGVIKHSHSHSTEDIGLMNALLGLKNKDKEPLILFYIEGYSCKEISEFFGISEGAVKKRLERARRRLRDKYEESQE